MKMSFSGSQKPGLSKTRNPSAPRTAGRRGGRFAANSMNVLRRRLTLLYAVTTSLILTLVMAAFLIMRIRETRQGQMEDFYDLWNSLQFRLQSDTTIAQGFLAQTEADHKVVIHIEENGTALLYNGSWQPQTPRAELIGRVKALAEAEGVFTTVRPISASSVVSSIFTFQGESGEDYCARVLVSAFGRSVRALCLIAYVPPVTDALRTTLIWLAALELLGVAGLSAISWYFVGWSLRPVAESQRKQAEFIAAASHELRSPLAVLRSGIAALQSAFAEVSASPRSLSGEDASGASVSGLLSTFDSECGRMARLIDDMLLLASADARTWKLTMSDVDLDTLLIDTYDAWLPLCRGKGIGLRLALPEEPLPVLKGDAERIRQILAILLDNAAAYTPAGKDILLSAEPVSDPGRSVLHSGRFRRRLPAGRSGSVRIPSPARQARIPGVALPAHRAGISGVTLPVHQARISGVALHVADQGPGIPDDVKPYIFDRFYRADSARSDKSHFGLGLSIAKELAALHGGSLSVSDTETGGSCFTAVFPLNSNAAD